MAENIRGICIAVLLTAFLALTGCVTSEDVQEAMQSWVGKHQSELIQAWGPPQSVTSDGKDGAILMYAVYVDQGQQTGQANVDFFGNVSYTTPQQLGYQRTRMMYVDAKGYIYYFRWQGI